jgi:hypothetical protein
VPAKNHLIISTIEAHKARKLNRNCRRPAFCPAPPGQGEEAGNLPAACLFECMAVARMGSRSGTDEGNSI